ADPFFSFSNSVKRLRFLAIPDATSLEADDADQSNCFQKRGANVLRSRQRRNIPGEWARGVQQSRRVASMGTSEFGSNYRPFAVLPLSTDRSPILRPPRAELCCRSH